MTLTLKGVNAAIAGLGIDLSVVQSDDSFYPFTFEGPGVQFIHNASVAGHPSVKRVNDLTLDQWLDKAKRIAGQVSDQLDRLRLPSWMRVGATVVASQQGRNIETVIIRIHGDGSDRITILLEDSERAIVWMDGRHCVGPELYRDQAAYDEEMAGRARVFRMLKVFTSLTTMQQIDLLQKAECLV